MSDNAAVAIDYESTYSTREKYSLSCMPTWQYCADERFDAYLVAICGWEITDDGIFEPGMTLGGGCYEEGWEPGKTVTRKRADGSLFRKLPDGRQLYIGRPERFPDWENLKGRLLLAHNASFDEVVTLELVKRGALPSYLHENKWACTADLAAFLMAPRNLKGACKELLGLEISKEVRSNMDGKHDYDLSAEDYRALVEYGGSDAVECDDLWLKYAHEWPYLERRVSELNRESTIRGIRLDLEYVKASKKELERYLAELTADIPWAPEKPVGSLAALRQAVIALGIDPPESFRKDDPRFLRWLETHDNLPFIKARQKAASVTVNLARVKSMLDTVDPDGRSHPAFMYGGAHTLRFSGRAESGGNVNLLNLPRKPVMQGDEHIFGGKGVDIRGMYIPDPGCKFAVFDYAQIESRFALWLVDDTHMMEAMKTEGNLYVANAVRMGWCKSGDKIKKTNPDLYRLAKCCVLGLGYGMGAAKFVDSCKAQGLDLPSMPIEKWPEIDRRLTFIIRNVARIKGDPFAECNRARVGQLLESLRIVTDWRNANSKIVAKWREYEEVFKQRIAAGKDTVAIRLPGGRIKRYFHPHLCKEETIEIDENGKEHPSFRIAIKATVVRGNPPVFLNGGAIMENIIQAACRDILMNAIVEIADTHPEWKYVFNVYDECIFQIPEKDAEEAQAEIPRIMTRGDRIKDWTEGLMLEVEGDICDRYHK